MLQIQKWEDVCTMKRNTNEMWTVTKEAMQKTVKDTIREKKRKK